MKRVQRRSKILGVAVVAFSVIMLFLGPDVGDPVMRCARWPDMCGFDEIAPQIFVEKGTSLLDRQAVILVVEQGRAQLAEHFDQMQSDPMLIICLTDECMRMMAHEDFAGVAHGDSIVLINPIGTDPSTIAHELTHTELTARQLQAGFDDEIPAWLHEGLAEVVAHGPVPKPRPCPNVPLPDDYIEWHATGWSAPYDAAACHAQVWLDENGGWPGLIRRLETGGPFP